MYRIELSPGEETVFRSIEELAVALKRGVVSSRARVWHNATSKWLPIQFHPHYKIALTLPLSQAALVAGPQARPLSSLNLELPPEPEPEIPQRMMPATVAAPVEPPPPKKKARSKPAGESRNRRRSKPRRQLRVALIGALLIGGAQWVLSAPLFSRAKAPLLLDAQRQLGAVHAAMRRVTSPNTAGMIPVLPSAATAATPGVLQPPTTAPGRVTAPSFGGNSSAETAAAPIADSVRPLVVDSTRRKGLQGILTTVSGAEAGPATPPARH
jgi:hypothetical protein